MIWLIVAIASSVAATVIGVVTDDAAVMILGFFTCLISVGSTDFVADRINEKTSDNLNGLNRHRVGYEDEDRREA